MKRTGIFASEEEKKELQEMVEEASHTPVMTLAMNMPSFAAVVWKQVTKHCHALALSHGLPEIQGYYGMDTTGEFVEAE